MNNLCRITPNLWIHGPNRPRFPWYAAWCVCCPSGVACSTLRRGVGWWTCLLCCAPSLRSLLTRCKPLPHPACTPSTFGRVCLCAADLSRGQSEGVCGTSFLGGGENPTDRRRRWSGGDHAGEQHLASDGHNDQPEAVGEL
jgi:hypothetical protein